VQTTSALMVFNSKAGITQVFSSGLKSHVLALPLLYNCNGRVDEPGLLMADCVNVRQGIALV
jgi:hypothetical protein